MESNLRSYSQKLLPKIDYVLESIIEEFQNMVIVHIISSIYIANTKSHCISHILLFIMGVYESALLLFFFRWTQTVKENGITELY